MTLLNRIITVLSVAGCVSFASAQTYTNIATEQGISVYNVNPSFGCGVSFVDFDQDGWDDITFGTKETPIQFLKNNQGDFELISIPGIVINDLEVNQITWVDYDNDGDLDLCLGFKFAPVRLYKNIGDFTFELITPGTGIPQDNARNRNITWVDYDRDGDLDLYIGKTEAEGTGIEAADYWKYNNLLRNDGDDTFVDVTMAAGVSDSIGITYGTIWWDYDMDGWPDLYVTNDKWFDNGMYRNNGDGTFEDVSSASGLGVVMDSMCASAADYDNDGDLDMYVTNTPYGMGGVGNALFQNNGDGTFQNVAPAANVSVGLIGWGTTWLDYDNDGWMDMYTAANQNFLVTGLNRLYKNDGDGTFTQANSLAGMSGDSHLSFSNATGDIDNDGYPDLAVNNAHPTYSTVWQNSGHSNNWIKVLLEGVVSNRDGIGALIECFTEDMKQIRYTHCGENMMAQNSKTKIIGVGTHDVVDSLFVHWPSGHVDRFYGVEPNQLYHIVEGSSLQPELNLSGDYNYCGQGETIVLEIEGFEDYVWSTGETTPQIEVSEDGTYFVTVFNEFGLSANSDTLHLNIFNIPETEVVVADESCPGLQNGSITVGSNHQIASIDWDEEGVEGIQPQGLAPGEYHFTITDENNCSNSGIAIVNTTEPIVVIANVTNASCFGFNDGSIALSAEVWDISDVQWEIGDNGTSISNLPAGAYTYLLTDENGCQVEGLVQVEEPVQLIVNEEVADVSCYGQSDGAISLSIDGPTAIGSVEWDNGATGNELNALVAGVYGYTLIDVNGCEASGNIEIDQPVAMNAEVVYEQLLNDCSFEGASFTATLSLMGGSPPFQLSWEVFDDQGNLMATYGQTTIVDCIPGLAQVILTIVDGNDCEFVQEYELEEIVSVDELEGFGMLNLFPNPTSDVVNVVHEGQVLAFELFDNTGRRVASSNMTGNAYELDLTGFAPGIYILQLRSTEGLRSFRVIRE